MTACPHKSSRTGGDALPCTTAVPGSSAEFLSALLNRAWALPIRIRIEAALDAAALITAYGAWSTDFISTFDTSKGRANPSQTEEATNSRSGDGFEGRSPRGRGRQAFGQVIESSCVHVHSFLRQRTALPRISSTQEGARQRVTLARNQLRHAHGLSVEPKEPVQMRTAITGGQLHEPVRRGSCLACATCVTYEDHTTSGQPKGASWRSERELVQPAPLLHKKRPHS